MYSSDVSLNDVLHLQCKGICTLEPCLGEFTGLKTLYLEQNALSDLSGLAPLVNLRCLYLGRNMLESINGLDSLLQLDSLDLSDNYLTQVSGLGHLSGTLRTLNLSGNKLATCEAIRPLQQLTALNSLDLANNKLAEEEAVDLLAAMPLSLLRLVGNPVVGTYRCVHMHSMQRLELELRYSHAPPCAPMRPNQPMRSLHAHLKLSVPSGLSRSYLPHGTMQLASPPSVMLLASTPPTRSYRRASPCTPSPCS